MAELLPQAEELVADEDFDEAIGLLQKAVELRFASRRGTASYLLRECQIAIEDAAHEAGMDELLPKAREHFSAGQYAQATALLEEAVKFRYSTKHNEAEKLLLEARESAARQEAHLQHDRIAALQQMAWEYIAAKRLEEAIDALEDAEELAPLSVVKYRQLLQKEEDKGFLEWLRADPFHALRYHMSLPISDQVEIEILSRTMTKWLNCWKVSGSAGPPGSRGIPSGRGSYQETPRIRRL